MRENDIGSMVIKKRVQTYLRLTGCRLGYLLYFSEEVMKDGMNRCMNGLEE